MDLYFIADFNGLTSAVLAAEAANIDRRVHFAEYGGNSVFSFSETGEVFGIHGLTQEQYYVLPAGKELWVASSPTSETSNLKVLVTSIGR